MPRDIATSGICTKPTSTVHTRSLEATQGSTECLQDGVCTVDVGFVQMPDVTMSRGMWLATLLINNAVDVQVVTTIAC